MQTKEGDIGEKEHVRTSRKRMAEIEADAVHTENEKQREIIGSVTQLEIAKSNLARDRQIAEYQVGRRGCDGDSVYDRLFDCCLTVVRLYLL